MTEEELIQRVFLILKLEGGHMAEKELVKRLPEGVDGDRIFTTGQRMDCPFKTYVTKPGPGIWVYYLPESEYSRRLGEE